MTSLLYQQCNGCGTYVEDNVAHQAICDNYVGNPDANSSLRFRRTGLGLKLLTKEQVDYFHSQ